MDFLVILTILASFFVGWGIGANDAANCMGTAIGANVIDYKKAVKIVALFAFLGAGLQGRAVMSTVGKGIANPEALSQLGIFSILLVTAVVVLVFTMKGFPVSTTVTILGSIAGIGLITQTDVNWFTIVKIVFFGIVAMLASLVISYIIYRFFAHYFSRGKFLFVEKRLTLLIILSIAFLSYSLGANNIGNAVGLVVEKKMLLPIIAGFLGGLAISTGAYAGGKRVVEKMSGEITALDARMAFSVQTAAAISLYVLALVGIPASITFVIVGSIAGAGFVKGMAAVDTSTIKSITTAWILTPIVSAALSVITFKLLSLFGI